ncbi:MAG: hypothetical protein N2047_04075 [Meiothermus sp.]|nr:hypothetical protein [Meiothermus sp.]
MKFVTVATGQDGSFLAAVKAAGGAAQLVRILPEAVLIRRYCCRPDEVAGTLPPCPVYAVRGLSRKQLRKLPGVKRVRAQDNAPSGKVVTYVC